MKTTVFLTDQQLENLLENLIIIIQKDLFPKSPITRRRTKEDLKALEDALANLKVAFEGKDNINKFGVNPTIE